MRFAVIVFPGSNCDRDVLHALATLEEVETESVWHQSPIDLTAFDALILPGGFSYGDTLRAGAIAQFSPIMERVVAYAEQQRGLILGICNGFQILTEAGLLPGALHENQIPRFLCQHQPVRVETSESPFTNRFQPDQVVDLPIAHAQGSYHADPEVLTQLQESDRIAFCYAGPNPNGSLKQIAGVLSEDRRILGLMPHPERNALPSFGDGLGAEVFRSMVDFLRKTSHTV